MDIEDRYGIDFKFSCTTLRSSRRRPDLGVRNSWVSCGYIGVKCFGDTQGKHLLPTKVHIVKPLVFSSSHVWMWELDYKQSWALKNWYFWREDSWESLRQQGDPSILKEISPEYSLEGLMLKLKLQHFGHLMRRTDSFEKTLMLGKIEGRRRRGTTEDEMVGWHHRLNGHEFE